MLNYISIIVGENDGYEYLENILCFDGFSSIASTSHGTPYDCAQLCNVTENCSAFLFGISNNICLIQEESPCISRMSHAEWDAYLRIGK